MIVRGDARRIPLADRVVQTCVTSPPYWGLRDYGIDGQIGLEPTPEAYVATMVEVFRETWRVLRDDGTLWLNLGSSFAGSGKGRNGDGSVGKLNSEKQRSNAGAVFSELNVLACDTSDKARSGSRLSDSTLIHLCDGCRVALVSRDNSHNGHSLSEALAPSLSESSREHRESSRGHLPTSDCDRRVVRNSDANLDSLLSQDLEGGPLPASQMSMLLESFSQRPAGCRHCANCDACLYVLGSATRDSRRCARRDPYTLGKDETQLSWRHRMTDMVLSSEAWRYLTTTSLKAKDDCAIPYLVVLALRMDGWYFRSPIIWAKPNPMPESVTDRPTRSHEYLFLLAKSERYFYDADAIAEAVTGNTHSRGRHNAVAALPKLGANGSGIKNNESFRDATWGQVFERNRRSVWTIPTEPTPEAHFATFPQRLVEPCILAGSRAGDIVLDPFLGSGTVGKVAERLGRRWVGLELSAEYIEIAEKRTAQRGLMLG